MCKKATFFKEFLRACVDCAHKALRDNLAASCGVRGCALTSWGRRENSASFDVQTLWVSVERDCALCLLWCTIVNK